MSFLVAGVDDVEEHGGSVGPADGEESDVVDDHDGGCGVGLQFGGEVAVVLSADQGLAHVVGYVQYPTKDSSGFYYREDFEGVDGAEKYFNSLLQGKNGLKLVDSSCSRGCDFSKVAPSFFSTGLFLFTLNSSRSSGK